MMWEVLFQVNMTNVVEDINDKHMKPWADACMRDGISNTPLNPFIDQVWHTVETDHFSKFNFNQDFLTL